VPPKSTVAGGSMLCHIPSVPLPAYFLHCAYRLGVRCLYRGPALPLSFFAFPPYAGLGPFFTPRLCWLKGSFLVKCVV